MSPYKPLAELETHSVENQPNPFEDHNLYLGDTNVSTLGGLAAAVDDNAVISIVPAVAGGGR